MRRILFLLIFIGVYFQAQRIQDKEALKKCRKEFNKKTCLSDEDRDSIPFYLDHCPNEAGPAENNGCQWPDRDKDGVLDKDDHCPELAGPSENNGCPWPDTDEDGILDKDDACPTIPGISEFNGCPDPVGKKCREILKQDEIRYEKLTKEYQNIGEIYSLFNKKVIDIAFSLYPKEIKRNVGIGIPFIKLNPSTICGMGCPNSFGEDHYNFLMGKFWSQEALEYAAKKYNKNIRIKGQIPSDNAVRQDKLKELMGNNLFNYLFRYHSEEEENIIIPSKSQQQAIGYFQFYIEFINPYTIKILVGDKSIIYEYKNNSWRHQEK